MDSQKITVLNQGKNRTVALFLYIYGFLNLHAALSPCIISLLQIIYVCKSLMRKVTHNLLALGEVKQNCHVRKSQDGHLNALRMEITTVQEIFWLKSFQPNNKD